MHLIPRNRYSSLALLVIIQSNHVRSRPKRDQVLYSASVASIISYVRMRELITQSGS